MGEAQGMTQDGIVERAVGELLAERHGLGVAAGAEVVEHLSDLGSVVLRVPRAGHDKAAFRSNAYAFRMRHHSTL